MLTFDMFVLTYRPFNGSIFSETEEKIKTYV